jgi:hypothetical protein
MSSEGADARSIVESGVSAACLLYLFADEIVDHSSLWS